MKALKWLSGIALVVVAASVLIRSYVQAHQDADKEEEKRAKVQVPSPSSVVSGQTIITLDEAAQKRLGIAAVTLRAMSARKETTAAATVLPAQSLVTLRNAYVTARAQMQKAQVNVDVSRQEYERLKTLYQTNQNASQKAFQAAEGTMRMNQADLAAAEQQLDIEKSNVQQSWSSVVAGWLVNDSPDLDRVSNQSAFLVQMTLPPGEAFTDPQAIELSTPGGNTVDAHYISPFPRVDPRIQGIGLLYLTPARAGLAPGMNLVARFPAGPRFKGALVPQAAVVWWQGQAWVYKQTAPTQFTRKAIATDMPIGNGFFVSQGLSPGSKVVIRGAQMLLSVESQPQPTQGGGEEDTD